MIKIKHIRGIIGIILIIIASIGVITTVDLLPTLIFTDSFSILLKLILDTFLIYYICMPIFEQYIK